MFIKDLIKPAYQVSQKMLVSEVKEKMKGQEVISSVVVISDNRPIGLVMNIHPRSHIKSKVWGVSVYQPTHKDCDG